MRNRGRAARGLAFGAGLALASGSAWGQIPERFTNLRVLPKDSARKELVTTMRGWASALGVRCGHCHAGGNPETLQGVDFASDEKWEKRTARAMLRMVRAVEADYLRGLEARPASAGAKPEPSVTLECITCHRGLRRPETIDVVLERVLRAEGPAAAVSTYKELRAQYLGRGSFDFSERPVNRLAESLLREKRSREAVQLLEMSAEFNPDAAWQQHLLGEARLAEGDSARALAAFERALALNPGNELTQEKVRELRAAGTPARRGSFVLDIEPNHSTLSFGIPIAGGMTRVTGKFGKFAGRVVLDEEDLARCSVTVDVQAASIDTAIDQRDAHLREREFLDAAAHPSITFVSERIERTAEGYRALGPLTLRGVTKPAVLSFRKTGLDWKDGRPILGVAGEFKLSRSAYGVGVGWRHDVIENFLGDEVGVEFFVWTHRGRPVEAP